MLLPRITSRRTPVQVSKKSPHVPTSAVEAERASYESRLRFLVRSNLPDDFAAAGEGLVASLTRSGFDGIFHRVACPSRSQRPSHSSQHPSLRLPERIVVHIPPDSPIGAEMKGYIDLHLGHSCCMALQLQGKKNRALSVSIVASAVHYLSASRLAPANKKDQKELATT